MSPSFVAVFGSPSRPTCFHAALFRPSFVRGLPLFPVVFPRSRLASSAAGGGDEQNRTVDPLLARQVLSQLSYTPIFTGLLLQGEYAFVHRFVKVPAPAAGTPRSPVASLPTGLPRSAVSACATRKIGISAVFPLGAFKIKQRIEQAFPTPSDEVSFIR